VGLARGEVGLAGGEVGLAGGEVGLYGWKWSKIRFYKEATLWLQC
jgi:hypothetical protein